MLLILIFSLQFQIQPNIYNIQGNCSGLNSQLFIKIIKTKVFKPQLVFKLAVGSFLVLDLVPFLPDLLRGSGSDRSGLPDLSEELKLFLLETTPSSGLERFSLRYFK